MITAMPKPARLRGTIDAFGRPANEWKYGTENIGEYSNDSTLIATYEGVKVQKGALYDLVGATTYERLDPESTWTIDDATAYDLDVWVDGQKLDDATQVHVSDYFARNSSGAAGTADAVGRGANVGVTGNGVLTQVYMDDNNNVTIVIINTYLVKATADYNETRESLSIEVIDDINTTGTAETPAIGTTIDNEDIPVSNFKEDDYILVTYAEGEGIQTAQLAEMVTGEVSEYTETENVYIGGEKYTYNKLVGTNQSGVTYTIGEDAVVVLDAYGHILYVDQAVSTNSYIFIENETTINNSKTARYNAYFTDGTYQEIVVKRYNGGTSTSDVTHIPAGWYTFSADENDRYSLNSVRTPVAIGTTGSYVGTNTTADNDSSAVVVANNGEVAFAPVLTNIKGDSSTIFVVLESDNDVTVYTGVANVPDITIPRANGNSGDPDYVADDQTATLYAAYNQNNGYADYVFIDLTSAPDADVDDANSVSDFLLILKSTGNKTYVANDEYWQYEVLMDGEKTTKYIAEYIVNDDDGVLMRNVKENSKGYITDADVFDDAARRDVIGMDGLTGTITFSGDTLSINGKIYTGATPAGADASHSYILADNCNAVLMVEGGAANADLLKDDAASYELYQATARAIAGTVKNYNLTGTVYMALDTDNSHVITDLYVTVYGSDEVEAPSNEAGIASVTVKGLPVNGGDPLEEGVTYNITVPYAANQNSEDKMEVTPVSAQATVAVYEGVNGTTNIYTDANLKANGAFTGLTGGVTFKIVVTAQDGETTTTAYVKVTTVETASTGGLKSNNESLVKVTGGASRGVEVLSDWKDVVTVSQLLSALGKTGANNDADTIEIVDPFSGNPVSGDSLVTAGMKVVYTRMSSPVEKFEYPITFGDLT